MTPHPYAKELKVIENYIYSSMNHTDEWKAAEQAYQNILSRPAPLPELIAELTTKTKGEWDKARKDAAAKAREDVLKDIETFCKTNVVPRASEQWDSGYNTGMGDVLNRCKSLRAGGERP